MWNRAILRDNAGRAHALLMASDILLTALVFVALLFVPELRRPAAVGDFGMLRLLAAGLVASLSWPLVLHERGLYRSQRRSPIAAILLRLVIAAIVPTVTLAATVFVLSAPVSPQFPVVCGLGQAAALGSSRLVIFIGLRVLRRRGHNFRSLLVVGSGPLAARMVATVESHPEWGLRIVGFVDDTDDPVDLRVPAASTHKLADFQRLMTDLVVDEVVVACPRSMLDSIGPVVGFCAEVGTPVTLLSDLFGDYLPPPRAVQVGSLAALSFAPVHHGRMQLAVKRGMDVVGAGVLLAVFAPVIGVAALLIRATSPGPAFFRNRRCGLRGRPFEMLKLRTMYVDAEERQAELSELNEMDGPVFKIRDDPRVTPVGRVLRRWSLDETPQFWNVLKGEISLVGPRPPVPAEVAQYAAFERRRLSMRPGITCLWQVSGRNSVGFEDWVKLDLEYIDTWTLGKDLEILLKTIPAVLRGTGAS
jgi:exopolysaccharide biosynthesis polyprenyl glycosylphosphotransferase